MAICVECRNEIVFSDEAIQIYATPNAEVMQNADELPAYCFFKTETYHERCAPLSENIKRFIEAAGTNPVVSELLNRKYTEGLTWRKVLEEFAVYSLARMSQLNAKLDRIRENSARPNYFLPFGLIEPSKAYAVRQIIESIHSLGIPKNFVDFVGGVSQLHAQPQSDTIRVWLSPSHYLELTPQQIEGLTAETFLNSLHVVEPKQKTDKSDEETNRLTASRC